METSQPPCHSCLLAGVPNKQQASLVDPTDKPQCTTGRGQSVNVIDIALIYDAEHVFVLVRL